MLFWIAKVIHSMRFIGNLFSVKLNQLLAQSSIAKVVHINGSVIGKIHLDSLQNPTYNKKTSVWQNSVASALLVHFWKDYSKNAVDHIHWNPGIVNTQTVKSQGKVVRFLSKLMGMEEPDQTGEAIAGFIDKSNQDDVGGRFFMKEKEQATKSKIINGRNTLNDLLSFSESFTGISL